jgi:uncharacterized protein with GYD domain
MPKYLLQVSYTAEGAKGLQKDGGTKRRKVAQGLIEGLGGKLDALYFSFGDCDVVTIVDMPDAISAAAASVALAASGAATGKTIALITPEEMDKAVKKTTNYTPPGR